MNLQQIDSFLSYDLTLMHYNLTHKTHGQVGELV